MVARYWSVNVNARFFVYLAWFDEGGPTDYRAVSVEFLERIEQGVGRRVPRLMCCRMGASAGTAMGGRGQRREPCRRDSVNGGSGRSCPEGRVGMNGIGLPAGRPPRERAGTLGRPATSGADAEVLWK